MTYAEVLRALERVTSEPARDLFELTFRTGLRRAELASLTPASFHGGRISVHEGKTAADDVWLADDLGPLVKRILARVRPDGRLFGSEHTIAATFTRWRRKLDEPRWKCHGLRHSFVTALVDAGVPIQEVQRAARHKTLAMTMRYFHGKDSARRATVNALAPPRSRDASAG